MTNPIYHQTVVASPQWQAWEKVADEHGFDWDESVEWGWLSPEHFQAFLAFEREQAAREERGKCIAEMKIHKQNKKFITIKGTLQMMSMIELIETGALTTHTK